MATSVTTSTDDIMNLSSITPTSETMSHKPELQLSLQDLLYPTELAENLLESLSNDQLNIIQQAVTKIKQRKLGCVNILNQNTKDIEQASCNSDNTPSNHQEPSNWDLSIVTETLTEPLPASSQACTSDTNTMSLDKDEDVKATVSPTVSSVGQHEEELNSQQQKTLSNPKSSAKPPVTSHTPSTSPFLSSHEPTTELKEGVEWVSFVYSHHRTLRRYCIRTDLDKVDIDLLDEEFKRENCVYPRANLPKETYRGNRWSYETECNVLGWKLAYLNLEEIAGKRGLIQRAVDSYRNRYPSMRSRRVARQEKLLKGTLRKRKHRDSTNTNEEEEQPNKSAKTHHDVHNEKIPKTMLIEDIGSTTKCRIRINIETVSLDAIDMTFRKNNCVFPRAIQLTPDMPNLSQRRIDEVRCNEIGWKLSWLNPRQLANKKNLLQRALDLYRNQFTPDLKARKHSHRNPPVFPPAKEEPIVEKTQANTENSTKASDTSRQTIPLTAEALAEQQKEYEQLSLTESTLSPPGATSRRGSIAGQSCYSGTTVTLDFHDYCFSPPPEEDVDMTCEEDTTTTTTTTTLHDLSTANSPIFPSAAIFDDLMLATMSSKNVLLGGNHLLHNNDESNSSMNESTGSSYQNTPSPQALLALSEIYQQAFLMSTASSDSAANELFNANIGSKDDSMFLMTEDAESSNIIELIARFGTVDAGIGSFTNHTTSVADSSLLSQLF